MWSSFEVPKNWNEYIFSYFRKSCYLVIQNSYLFMQLLKFICCFFIQQHEFINCFIFPSQTNFKPKLGLFFFSYSIFSIFL